LWLLAASPVALYLAWWAARRPQPGAFYKSAAPGNRAGLLLRVEPYKLHVPRGAKAWRILYTTSREDGSLVPASAIVMVSAQAPTPIPVVAWAHATTGIATCCGPSVRRPFIGVPALRELLDQGWAYVAADYVGLGPAGKHGYLVGREEAYSVLDAVRAAHQIAGAFDIRTVIWGHSQGGHAALWSGMLAPHYAPELNVLGVAALAPASDLRHLTSAQNTPFGKMVSSYLIKSYGEVYPDVVPENYVHGRSLFFANDIAGRCAGGWDTVVSLAETVFMRRKGIFSNDPLSGSLGARLAENSPEGPFAMPVLIAQGDTDDLVPERVQRTYVLGLRKDGQPVEYLRVPRRGHFSLVFHGSPLTTELIRWTRARFNCEVPLKNCSPVP